MSVRSHPVVTWPYPMATPSGPRSTCWSARSKTTAWPPLIEEGVDTRYGAGATAEIRRRLQRELASTTGMLRLFCLIVANIVAFARRDCLPVRTRGSTVSKKPDRFVRLTHKNLAKPTHSCQVFAQFLNLSCPP